MNDYNQATILGIIVVVGAPILLLWLAIKKSGVLVNQSYRMDNQKSDVDQTPYLPYAGGFTSLAPLNDHVSESDES